MAVVRFFAVDLVASVVVLEEVTAEPREVQGLAACSLNEVSGGLCSSKPALLTFQHLNFWMSRKNLSVEILDEVAC